MLWGGAYSGDESRRVFAVPFRGDEAREVYREVKGRAEKDFKDVPAFNAYFEFNEKTGEINGSSIFHGILIDDVLGKNGLWMPTIPEAKKLDAAGKLTNNVYRDYGIVVYNKNSPNSDIAEILVKEANKRAWKLPILAPFKALKPEKGGKKYGVDILFKEDAQGIMTGEEAEQYLSEQFNYGANSGAHRLIRLASSFLCAGWCADWNSLAISDACGRVDFVCGEATAKNLESSVLKEVNMAAKSELEEINAKISEINAKISNTKEAALKVLRS